MKQLLLMAVLLLCGCKPEPKSQLYGYAAEQERVKGLSKEERQAEQLHAIIKSAVLEALQEDHRTRP